MIRFLHPELPWLLALLALLAIWLGRKGRVATVAYSNVAITRTIARNPEPTRTPDFDVAPAGDSTPPRRPGATAILPGTFAVKREPARQFLKRSGTI